MTTQPDRFPYDGESSPDEISLADRYVHAIRRHWLLIFVAALIGGAIAFGGASLQRLRYQGVTTLLVVPPPPSPSDVGRPEVRSPQINPATFRAIVENATLAAQVIAELKLDALTPQKFLNDALRVEEIRGTSIVRITVTLFDPATAAEASRRLAAKAIALTEQISQKSGASIQEQLQNHLRDAERRLATSEKDLLAYKQGASVDLPKEDAAAQPYRRSIELARREANFEIAKRIYADLAVRFEQSRTQPVGSSPQLQIVDEAIPADRPVSRWRLQYGVLGAAAGLVVGVLVALLLERRRI